MRARLFLVLFAAFMAFGAPAQAQRMADGETLDRILPEIRAAHPGRLSDAEPWIDDSGRTHYRIKWMTPEGRILFFDVDARSGRFTGSGGENEWRGGRDRYDGGDTGGDGRSGDDGDYGRHGRSNFDGNRNNGNDWGGHGGGDWHDRHGDGDWRGRHEGGDNGGWHHHDREH